MYNTYSTQPQRRPMFYKRAVAVLTPEAMQAAMQPPPPDPAAMGGMPMDPSMQGGMMPPGGAPMDPAMMGGQPPMDPAMAGGMPPQGGAPAGGIPPEVMQDPMFQQFLMEVFGIMMDPRSGQFFDQNGQPVPPDMLMQAYDAYMQGMQQLQMQQGGGMPPMGGAPMDPAAMGGQPPMDPSMMGGAPAPMPPQGGMPMDPAMMGGQPPMDPGMAQGAPMDPAMAGGMPPEGGEGDMDPMMSALADLITNVMEETIVTPMKEELAAMQKQFADLKEMLKTMRDDMGTIRTDVDSQTSQADENSMLRSELAAELQPTLEPEPAPADEGQPKEASLRPVNIMDLLGGK